MAGKYLAVALMAVGAMGAAMDGGSPGFKTDPNTSKYCSFWFDSDGSVSCQEVVDNYVSGSKADFFRWNPSITASCGNFQKDQSYCVEARGEPKATTSTTPAPPTAQPTSTKTTMTTSTTTKPSNGITTPTPTQPDIVDNCDKFYYVKKGDQCDGIAAANGISVQDLKKWNPKAGSQCTGLWADAYACVHVIGGGPGTPTTPPNGVNTPSPTQPSIVDVCSKFHLVRSGQSCEWIAAQNGITVRDLTNWNPKANDNCSGLWADSYACVGIIRSYDFNGGNNQRWATVDGSFDASSRALVGSGTSKAVLKAPVSNFDYSIDVRVDRASGNAGIIFRASDVGDGADAYRGYYAGIDAANHKVVLGRADRNWNDLQTSDFSVNVGQTVRVRVTAFDNQIFVYFDGQLKLASFDSTYSNGMVGVRTYQTGATFDNVRLIPVVYEGFSKNMVGWSIADGGFEASGHLMHSSKADSGKATLNAYFDDVIVEAVVSIPDGDGNAGLLFRADALSPGSDNYHGYYVGIETAGHVILGSVNGNWHELARASVKINGGNFYTIRVRAIGDAIDVYVDDLNSPKISIRNGDFRSGVNGFRVFHDSVTAYSLLAYQA